MFEYFFVHLLFELSSYKKIESILLASEFTIKSAFDMLRCRREKEEWRANMWGKQIPFKLSFLLWRIWKGRIATEENLKRMGVTIASRCYCCEEFEEETIQHLFLTAPIAQKLWKQFASCAGIQQHGCLKQMITGWWEVNTPIKLKFIFQAIPSIILWELWKRRNARRHGLDINFYKLKSQCVNTIIQLINMKYPWIKVPKNWGEMVKILKEYKPRLHYCAVSWRKPHNGTIKCNTDGASRGNPGESAYAFCLRNDKGDIVYAEAGQLGNRTNMEAEILAVFKALRHCKRYNFNNYILETDTLSITNIIRGNWKVPWQQAEEILEIIELISSTQAKIQHVFREANKLADKLANEAFEQTNAIQIHVFQQLSVECRGIVNMDKAEIPSLRIKTRKITVQATHQGRDQRD